MLRFGIYMDLFMQQLYFQDKTDEASKRLEAMEKERAALEERNKSFQAKKPLKMIESMSTYLKLGLLVVM